MDLSIVLAFLALVVACCALILFYLVLRRITSLQSTATATINESIRFISDHEKRLKTLEESWQAFLKEEEDTALAEATAKSEEMSKRGSKGVQIREENKEMRQAAMNEVRTLATSEGEIQAKMPQLAALVAKYPRVADEVADQAIREFKLEPFKDLIKGFVAAELQKAATTPSSAAPKKELWYGLEV